MADLTRIGLEGIESFEQRKLTQAQTRHFDMLARKGNIEADEAVQMQQLAQQAAAQLQNLGRGGSASEGFVPSREQAESDDMADPLERIASVFMMGGAPEKGAEFAKAASQIRNQQSEIKARTVTQEQNRLENIIKGADIVARQIGTARNQAEWDAGLDALDGIMEPEHIQALRDQGYNPNAAAFYREKAISASEQARLDLQQAQQDQTRRNDMDAAARDRQKIQLQTARDAETRRHNEAIEKAAGSNGITAATAPSEAAMKSARATLRNMVYPNLREGKEGPDFEAAATYVASEANSLLKANPALDWDTAVRRAILTGQAKNAFGDEVTVTSFLGIPVKKEKTGARFRGQNVADALAMPASKDQMQKGKYYITSRGRALWNGTSFELAE